MALPRVFVTRRIPQVGLDLLAEQCELDVWPKSEPPEYDDLRRRSVGAAGLLTMLSDRIDRELIEACPDLRVISQYAAGVDNIDLEAAREQGIAVGNTPGALTEASADLAFCLLISAARRLPEAVDNVKSGAWRTWEPRGLRGQDLVGAVVGIVGMGRIGSALASRCHFGFGMSVLYAGPSPKPAVEREMAARHVSLDELLSESDFVSLHCALTPETTGLIGARELDLMKPTAVLVNTARGAMVDTDALVAALTDGEIFAAGLDVADPEPLPPDHPLLALPNAVVTPHIGSATVWSRGEMAEIAARNLLAGLTGAELPHGIV